MDIWKTRFSLQAWFIRANGYGWLAAVHMVEAAPQRELSPILIVLDKGRPINGIIVKTVFAEVPSLQPIIIALSFFHWSNSLLIELPALGEGSQQRARLLCI